MPHRGTSGCGASAFHRLRCGYRYDYAIQLGDVQQANGGAQSAKNHPDQTFWIRVRKNSVREFARIDIDCSILPCDANNVNSCLFVVPRKVQDLFLKDKQIRFYSHRNVGLGETVFRTKRFFEFSTALNAEDMRSKYNNHKFWKWEKEL
jgi:hypothetical protein